MSKPTATAGWNVKRCASKKRTESINFNFITATSYDHRGYVSFPFFNRRVKKNIIPARVMYIECFINNGGALTRTIIYAENSSVNYNAC